MAGFDPARFWDLTPRLYVLEMDGALVRIEREREMVWWGAMLPRLKKPIALEEFVMRRVDDRERAKRFHAVWEKIDRALERNRK